VRFKLDENLSPSLAELFAAAGHEAHSVAQQGLGGQADARVIEVCGREQRAFVTLDLDFSNILSYPPAQFAGIIVLRLADQAHAAVEAAIRRLLDLLNNDCSPVRWRRQRPRLRQSGHCLRRRQFTQSARSGSSGRLHQRQLIVPKPRFGQKKSEINLWLGRVNGHRPLKDTPGYPHRQKIRMFAEGGKAFILGSQGPIAELPLRSRRGGECLLARVEISGEGGAGLDAI
jgi:predicted nuclease of predicted toxin-antitoxin system